MILNEIERDIGCLAKHLAIPTSDWGQRSSERDVIEDVTVLALTLIVGRLRLWNLPAPVIFRRHARVTLHLESKIPESCKSFFYISKAQTPSKRFANHELTRKSTIR